MSLALREQVDEAARARVAEGYNDADEIAEGLIVLFGEDARQDGAEDLDEVAEAATQAAMAAHLAAQASWPAITDCDRLDRAFAALEREGIVARQNFTCCQTCGHAEIGGPISEWTGDQPAIGYTFFHWQDTESAADGQGLRLAYGATQPGDDATVAVGRAVANALDREGLKVTWNGSLRTRIAVAMDWKKRR